MKLSTPTKLVFWLSTALAVLGILGKFIAIPFVSSYNFWLVAAGFVLLWLGNVLKGF